MPTSQERLSENFQRHVNLGARSLLERKKAMIDFFGAGGRELKEHEQAEIYDQMQADETPSAELMLQAIRRAQRPYRSLRGTAGIPRAFTDWDKREWAKRQKRALEEQAAEQPEEEGEA